MIASFARGTIGRVSTIPEDIPRTRNRSMSQLESTPSGAPTPQEVKAAFKAFKRRLKLTRLDEESKLGGGPMSGGRDSGIVAIMPPNQFPPAVWEELVRQGKLKKAGGGTYEVVEQ
jgi:hypothetical protein